MDPQLILYLVIIVIWFLAKVFGQMKKLVANRPRVEQQNWREAEGASARSSTEGSAGSWAPPPPPPPPPPTPEETLRELFRKMGGEVEVLQPVELPVPAEHTRTRGEHSQAPWEVRGSFGEHSRTASEHVHRPSDVYATPSEQAATASEHRRTASEHRRGDVAGAIDHSAASFARKTAHHRKGNRIGRQVRRELRGGGPALARAVLFEKILGPPRAVRAYGQGGDR